jgi:transcriptional regulator with XRE-family HTH domain
LGSEKDREELGKRLKMGRTINNLTLDEVANLIGSTKSTLSRYESGKRAPGQDVLKKLASTYKVPLDFLNHGTFYAFSQPGQLLIDFNETGRNIEVSKEDYEMSHNLLIEKVRQVVSDKIKKLGHAELIELLDIDLDDLRGMSHIFRNKSLKTSIAKLIHIPIYDLDELANIIDDYGNNLGSR